MQEHVGMQPGAAEVGQVGGPLVHKCCCMLPWLGKRAPGRREAAEHSRAWRVSQRQHHLLVALHHPLIQHVGRPDLQIKDVGAGLRGGGAAGRGGSSLSSRRHMGSAPEAKVAEAT